MGTASKIEWLNGGHTWSPWHGCANAVLPSGEGHPGCDHCYAEAMAKRNPGTLGIWGEGGTRIVSANWDKPRRWNDAAGKDGVRLRVFPSICDPFEEFTGRVLNHAGKELLRCCNCGANLPDNGDEHEMCDLQNCGRLFCRMDNTTLSDLRADFFKLIDETPNLDWLLLTKRPQNVRAMWPTYDFHACETGDCPHEYARDCDQNRGYRDNVWLLTSAGDQATADALIPELLNCRDLVPVLGLSAEPLLGPIDLKRAHRGPPVALGEVAKLFSIDWVIAGGESGPGARPCDINWIRSLVAQCKEAGTACFVKQLGAHVEWDGMQGGYGAGPSNVWPDAKKEDQGNGRFRVHLRDKKGGNPEEWPLDLRVRQMPEVRHA